MQERLENYLATQTPGKRRALEVLKTLPGAEWLYQPCIFYYNEHQILALIERIKEDLLKP